jgi:hypothetical protein
MPSFDIVSKVENHEVKNAVDQANREVGTRFDFKGSDAHFELAEDKVTLIGQNEFQLQQMRDILISKSAKRGIDVLSLEIKDPEVALHQAKQQIIVKQGISTEIGKKISKYIKDKKFKVQASIQGEQVRVTGKKRDDLQEVIAALRKESFELPLQFENFRD